MKHERYHIEASTSFLEFEFYSEGSKGKVKKKVNFVPFGTGTGMYNLAFGDVSADGEIDDLVVTNNGDSQKVLATVALTAYRFFEKYPNCYIYVTGSTKARIRLYRMGITNNLAEITADFFVYGFLEGKWDVFERGKEYEAFLVKRRKFEV